MKRSMLLSLVLLLVILSLACSALAGGGTSDPDNGGDAPPVVDSGDLEITVVNRSPDDVCYVMISESDLETWGEDRLGAEETIEPGANRVFGLDAGTYDVRLETCDEAGMATAWEISRNTTITVGASGATVRLLLNNESPVEVCYVMISPTTAESWGEDWLGEMETVQTDRQRIFYVEPGFYDLQVADCDGESLTEEYEVDLTDDLTWTVSE
jgi:hypothetical protein